MSGGVQVYQATRPAVRHVIGVADFRRHIELQKVSPEELLAILHHLDRKAAT